MTSEKVPPRSPGDSHKGGGGDARQPNLSTLAALHAGRARLTLSRGGLGGTIVSGAPGPKEVVSARGVAPSVGAAGHNDPHPRSHHRSQ